MYFRTSSLEKTFLLCQEEKVLNSNNFSKLGIALTIFFYQFLIETSLSLPWRLSVGGFDLHAWKIINLTDKIFCNFQSQKIVSCFYKSLMESFGDVMIIFISLALICWRYSARHTCHTFVLRKVNFVKWDVWLVGPRCIFICRLLRICFQWCHCTSVTVTLSQW